MKYSIEELETLHKEFIKENSISFTDWLKKRELLNNEGIDYTNDISLADLHQSLNEYIDKIAKVNNKIDLDAVYKGAYEFVKTDGARDYWRNQFKQNTDLAIALLKKETYTFEEVKQAVLDYINNPSDKLIMPITWVEKWEK